MASGYESLTNLDLRNKLLEFGYDLPISVKKDFMIKTLERVMAERRKQQLQGRKSLPVMSSNSRQSTPSSTNNHQFETNSNASTHSRQSRQSTGSSRASASKQPIMPLQPKIPVNDEIVEEDENEEEEEEEEEEESSQEEQTPPTFSKSKTTTNSSSNFMSHTSHSTRPQPDVGGQNGEWEDHDEEEENRTPSPRYQKYLSYFKGDMNKADPFVMPRSRYSSPVGSPYSTTATVGSPSFRRNQSYDFDDSADESDAEHVPVNNQGGRIRHFFSKVNPVNWIPNPKLWLSSSGAARQETDQTSRNHLNFNFGSAGGSGGGGDGRSSPFTLSQTRYSMTSGGNSLPPSTPLNGHFPTTSSSRAQLGNQIYSPAQPPPPVVPPAMAAGRQAGFKAFFSRGERNGFGYPSAAGASADSAHLVPKLLLVCFVVAIVGVLGAYYYKASVQPGLPGPDSDLSTFFGGEEKVSLDSQQRTAPPKPKRLTGPKKLVYPICGQPGYEIEPCVEKGVIQDSKILFEALKAELTQRSVRKSCGDMVEDKISLLKAKELLYRLVELKKSAVDTAFEGMLMLVTENPTSGVKICANNNADEMVKIGDLVSLNNEEASITIDGVSPTFWCMLVSFVFSILMYAFYFTIVGIIGYGTIRGLRYRRRLQAHEDDEMFKLIDRIVTLLQEHYEDAKRNGHDQFIAVNHIRDQLFSHRDKKQKEALWNKVVAEISTNESRVREEIQHISGEEFRVWRWLPSASPLAKRMSSAPSSPGGSGDSTPGLYPSLPSMDTSSAGCSNPSTPSNSQWQGQAFEIFDGSPNSLAQPPTTCLKIRQMFDNSKDAGDFRIEQAILEKCSNANILHIGIDRSTREGHLLSVKFLREDRYFHRFPDAQFRTTPLSTATLGSGGGGGMQQQPLSGLTNNLNIYSSGPPPAQHQGIEEGPSARARFSLGY
ncbi:Inner nuclear membrane protein Man1 [Folsomia candida]|uniref:Inner nuclear membrane protein Man1 n=1 Tax=Folsomia candida TaxID=158441 RepID=A0A226DZE3_FOLCA|nr:Inner nuclear membrane protein Man1 [Folsomia candida]